jgi:hypothetical protein
MKSKRFSASGVSKHFRPFLRFVSPSKIQDFLDFSCGYNFSPFTYSPIEVLKRKKANCLDGAVFAACALRFLGQRPLLVDLRAKRDEDHVLAVYKNGRNWGAIAQSKFSGLRFREGIFPSLRALACSYFDFYYNFRGEKTLREYSLPLDLSRFDSKNWMATKCDISFIGGELEKVRHYKILPNRFGKLRAVDSLEFEANARGSGSVPLTMQARRPIWAKGWKRGASLGGLPKG